MNSQNPIKYERQSAGHAGNPGAAVQPLLSVRDLEIRFPGKRDAAPVVNRVSFDLHAGESLSIVGESNVQVQEPTMGAEDFAYMLQAKPGAYCFIGNGDGSHREMGHGAGPCVIHNPSYDFNDDLIPLGATYWVRLAEEWLAQGA